MLLEYIKQTNWQHLLTFFQSWLPFCGSAGWPLCVPRSGRPDWLSTEWDCWLSPPETPHHPSNRPCVNIKKNTMSFFQAVGNKILLVLEPFVLHVLQFSLTSCLSPPTTDFASANLKKKTEKVQGVFVHDSCSTWLRFNSNSENNGTDVITKTQAKCNYKWPCRLLFPYLFFVCPSILP